MTYNETMYIWVKLLLTVMILNLVTIGSQAYVQPNIQLLTFLGKNRQPVFVTNNTFIYVSSNRDNLSDTQLYFKDFKTGKERQISHQKGSLSNGIYIGNKNQILYTSTTDEEKETPYILKNYLKRYPSSVKNDSFFHVDFSPQEIYQSKVDGSQVQRLTQFSGYDGFPTVLSKKNRLYFSRWHNGRMSLFAKSLDRNLAAWKVNKTAGHDLGLKLSPNETQFLWYRFSPDFKSSQIVYSDLKFNNTQYLTLEDGVNWSPTWHPNGKSVIYSARNTPMRDFDLYEISLDGECSRKISSLAGDEFYPAISPNGKLILFTSTKSGSEQIYKMDYPSPFECKKSKTQ